MEQRNKLRDLFNEGFEEYKVLFDQETKYNKKFLKMMKKLDKLPKGSTEEKVGCDIALSVAIA